MIEQLLPLQNKTAAQLLMALIALALLCTAGPAILTLRSEMPITLQSFVVVLVAVLFGWKPAAVAITAYLVLAMAGAPVLSGYKSSPQVFTSQFGGFFFGLLFSALITGFAATRSNARNAWHHMGLWVGGHIIILFFGALWLARFNPDGWWTMIKAALPGGAAKAAMGALLTRLIARALMGRNKFFEGKM